MATEPKSDVGHQYKKTQRAYEACVSSLGPAYDALKNLEDIDSHFIRMNIIKLMNKCLELSYSANEAFKQNQS